MGELDGSAKKELKDKSIESIDAKLFVESGDASSRDLLTAAVKAQRQATVNVTSQGITDPVPVFEETVDVPWEVDDFRTRFRKDVLPRVRPGERSTRSAAQRIAGVSRKAWPTRCARS